MSGLGDDWDGLALRFLDGSADPDEQREVRQRLLADEAARARFAYLACQQQALADVLRERPAPAARTAARLRFGRASGGPGAGLFVGLAAAALVVLALLLAAGLSRRPSAPPPAMETSQPPAPAAPDAADVPRPREERTVPVEAPPREPERPPEVERRGPRGADRAPMEVRPEPERPKAEERRPPPEPRRAETAVAAAALERVRGDVFVVSSGEKRPAKEKAALLEGEGIETSPGGSALIRFEDGTSIETAASATLRELRAGGGKRVFVAAGTVTAVVGRQPPGQPMVFATPHGEAKVLGTTLRIAVGAASTEIDVLEGRVQLKRLPDGRTVDVPAGHFAVAAAGADLVSRVRYPDTAAGRLLERPGAVTVNFGPPGLALPEGILNDSAEAYDPKRGFGWSQGAVSSGRSPGVSDILQATFVAGGSAEAVATWKMDVPNGRYLVTLSVGGPGAFAPDQGPHHVSIEGQRVVDAVVTRSSRFHVRRDVPVVVSDRDLTMTIGGHKTTVKTADGTDDTVINYLTVRRIP